MSVDTEKRIRDLEVAIKATLPLAPEDSVAKAARLLRARNTPALPVSHGFQLIGMVYEADLLAMSAAAADAHTFVRTTPVSQVMRPLELIVHTQQSVREAVQEVIRTGVPVAPVAGSDGRYVGLLFRRDLLAALSGEPIPAPIAGMATPFGVYLTTGALRAGAGDFALLSVGAAMMILNVILTMGLDRLIGQVHRWWPALDTLTASGVTGAAIQDIIFGLLVLLFFLLALRFSPISATHAAEHMVVHTIEAGEDLTLPNVKRMSPVHPRCGTNLVALMVLILIGYQAFMTLGADNGITETALLGFIVVVMITWRRLGHGLQRFVTTKQPSDKQILRAIDVGEELLANMAAHPGARAKPLRRVWNSGLPQVLGGFLLVFGLLHLVQWVWHISLLF